MSHELEHELSAVYAGNEPAWHRWGTVLPDDAITREQVIECVPELGSLIIPQPVLAVNGPDVVMTERWIANVREYDGKIVGVNRATYQTMQPSACFDFAEELIQAADGAIFDTAFTMRHGTQMILCVKLPGHIQIAGLEDERHDPYLMIANSFDGSMAFTSTISWVRAVCRNTVTWSLQSALRTFKLRHTENIEGRLQDARDAMALTYKFGDALDEMARQLLDVKIGEADVPAILEDIFPARPLQTDETELPQLYLDRLNKKREDVQAHWASADNLENVRSTGWGLLNAVTEWEQFLAHPNRQAENALDAILEDSPLADRAVARILAHA